MQGDFFLTNWILEAMRWIYSNIAGNEIVLTIIICTILLKCITLFADIKSRKSSLQMQSIQPQLDKLKKKYENNPEKFQREQSRIMKENGVSMLGGCLPLLIMMPLFFMFIAAFRFWGYEMTVRMLLELNETPGHSELFQSFQFLWVHNIWQPDNGTVSVIQDAASFFATKDLHNLLYFQQNPEAYAVFQQLFPMEMVNGAPQYTEMAIAKYNELVAPLAEQYAGFSNGWFILPILAGGTLFLSSWIMQKSPNSPKTSGNDAAQSTNKAMLYVMPIISIVACLSANAAFAVYWVISSVVSTISNLLITRAFNKKNQTPEVA